MAEMAKPENIIGAQKQDAQNPAEIPVYRWIGVEEAVGGPRESMPSEAGR